MLTKQELLKMKTTSESNLLSLTKKYNNLSDKWNWLPNFLFTRAKDKILRKIIVEQDLLNSIEETLEQVTDITRKILETKVKLDSIELKLESMKMLDCAAVKREQLRLQALRKALDEVVKLKNL